MATVRKQAGRALLVAWGMSAFWARQKVYVLTHLHRQITLLEARKTAPPPLNSPLAVKSQPFAEHGHVRLFVKPSSYEFLGAFFSKGRPFSIWLSTQFSRGCRGPPASGDAFSRGIEMACYVTPPVQCRWRCGERGLFDAKSVKLRISPKTGCVARFPAAFPFCSAGCFFQAGETMVVFAAAVRESSPSRSAAAIWRISRRKGCGLQRGAPVPNGRRDDHSASLLSLLASACLSAKALLATIWEELRHACLYAMSAKTAVGSVRKTLPAAILGFRSTRLAVRCKPVLDGRTASLTSAGRQSSRKAANPRWNRFRTSPSTLQPPRLRDEARM